MIDLAGSFTHAGPRFLKLASPQRVEEVPRKNHSLTLAPGKPLPDQVLDAGLHRVADLPAETAGGQGCEATTNKLAIKPGGAARVNLGVYWQVRANRQGDALAPGRILNLRSSTTAPGAASLAASRSATRTWWARPSTPSITAYAVPWSSSSRPRATSRPMTGSVAPPCSRAKSAKLRSMPWSASPLWICLMMSLRSPKARMVGSASSDRRHCAG